MSKASQTSLTVLEAIRSASNEVAWHTCYQLYAPLVLAFVKRMGFSDSDVADVVQDTFLAVSQHFAELTEPFDRSKGRFKAWLCGVARHKALDLRKRNAAIHRKLILEAAANLELDLLPDLRDAEATERRWEEGWRENCVRLAMEQVATEFSPATVQAAQLVLVDNLPANRVAKLLGKTLGAVHLAKHRVLKRLKAIIATLVEQEG